MRVYAKTDESDVGNIKIGKPVSFKVDAFPKDTFRGIVSQVRMNATTVQSVVTYDTIIEFANPELKLFPGMTAYVTIPVATVQNVLKLPNTALRYKPPDDHRRRFSPLTSNMESKQVEQARAAGDPRRRGSAIRAVRAGFPSPAESG